MNRWISVAGQWKFENGPNKHSKTKVELMLLFLRTPYFYTACHLLCERAGHNYKKKMSFPCYWPELYSTKDRREGTPQSGTSGWCGPWVLNTKKRCCLSKSQSTFEKQIFWEIALGWMQKRGWKAKAYQKDRGGKER